MRGKLLAAYTPSIGGGPDDTWVRFKAVNTKGDSCRIAYGFGGQEGGRRLLGS